MNVERLIDEILGEVSLNTQLDTKYFEYEVSLNVDDSNIIMYLYSDATTGAIEPTLKVGRRIVKDFEKYKDVVTSHLVDQFIPRLSANSGIAYSDEDVLSEIKLEDMTVHADGKFSFGFGSCESLGEHALIVYFSQNGIVESCDIVG